MTAGDKPILIYVTCPDVAVAGAIAESAVAMGLAACANVLPGMTTIYRWQGKIERASEVVLILKSMSRHWPALCAAVAARHPYETPAILRIDVADGAAPFLAWLAAETSAAET
ncbi:MAG: divalent-cation tolerance protein CutA [Hyphomicrobiaceae bacterium]|nr:divalent-cation tolerance protein CutA [Hyphomicrobiaceae bacterium]